MKKVVFCADGTWSHPKSTSTVSESDTNVYKLYKALPTTATQCPRYDDGVGVGGSLISEFLGGAFGEGLFAKIKEGYTKIAHDYLDGDEIFLFGFSRGAYTARSVAGMLTCCGLPTDLTQKAIDDAFATYRTSPQSPERANAKAALKANYGNRPVEIAMIGVWDTVGSLGIPSLSWPSGSRSIWLSKYKSQSLCQGCLPGHLDRRKAQAFSAHAMGGR